MKIKKVSKSLKKKTKKTLKKMAIELEISYSTAKRWGFEKVSKELKKKEREKKLQKLEKTQKKELIQKFEKVGFTAEQAEVLSEETLSRAIFQQTVTEAHLKSFLDKMILNKEIKPENAQDWAFIRKSLS